MCGPGRGDGDDAILPTWSQKHDAKETSITSAADGRTTTTLFAVRYLTVARCAGILLNIARAIKDQKLGVKLTDLIGAKAGKGHDNALAMRRGIVAE